MAGLSFGRCAIILLYWPYSSHVPYIPSGLLALALIIWTAARHAHLPTSLLVGLMAGAAFWLPLDAVPDLLKVYYMGNQAIPVLIYLGTGAFLGLLFTLAAKGVRRLVRRPPVPSVRGSGQADRVRLTGAHLGLALVVLPSLFWDALGWGFLRDFERVLHWSGRDGVIWTGWAWMLSWERTMPVVLGMLAAWMMLQQKHGYTRITRAYLLVSAAFGLARFFAWQLLQLDHESPGPLSLVGLDWSAIAQGFFDVTDRAALIGGSARVLLAVVGIVFLLPAATRRLRPPAGVS